MITRNLLTIAHVMKMTREDNSPFVESGIWCHLSVNSLHEVGQMEFAYPPNADRQSLTLYSSVEFEYYCGFSPKSRGYNRLDNGRS